MSLIEFNSDPTDRQLRQFACIVLPLCALLLAALVWWRLGQRASGWGILAVAALVAIGGLFRPALARPIYLGWMYASYPIGWAVGHLMIGVVFFIVVTPLGLLMRAFGRDPLSRKFDGSRTSYWEKRPSVDNPARYFRQF
jgi:hypothetical protein